MDDQLASAGLDEGFRASLLAFRIGTQPGAWRHLLATFHRERLWRFPAGMTFLQRALGLEWKWESGAGIGAWLERWVAMQTTSQNARLPFVKARRRSLPPFTRWRSKMVRRLSLAPQQTSIPPMPSGASRAFFLSLCPAGFRAPLLARIADDPDTRVCAVAIQALYGSSESISQEVNFSLRMESLLSRFPETVSGPSAPWPAIHASRNQVASLMVLTLSEGDELRMGPWLKKLPRLARFWLVGQLTRQDATPDKRALLLRLTRDSDFDVAKRAVGGLDGHPLSDEEAREIEEMLSSKQPKRRLLLLDLICSQPPASAVVSTRRLLAARKIEQRLAGLELLRRFAGDEAMKSVAAEIVRQHSTEELSADEQRQLIEIRELIFPSRDEVRPSSANAFGLVDPSTLPKYPRPKDRGVMLQSPNTVALLREMDDLLVRHGNDVFTVADYSGDNPKETTLATGVPRFWTGQTLEENRKRFPLISVWENWWKQRPAERRDPDGCELERMRIFLIAQDAPQVRFRNSMEHLSYLVTWLAHVFRAANWREFWLDATETMLARATGKLKDSERRIINLCYQNVISIPFREPLPTPGELRRFLPIAKYRDQVTDLEPGEQLLAATYGILTDEEVIWYFLGKRPPCSPFSNPSFAAFGMVVGGSKAIRAAILAHPIVRRIVGKCRDRIVELELKRGDEPEEWTYAAGEIRFLPGCENLVKIVAALGRGMLHRGRRSQGSEDFSRGAILSQLISACYPAPGDTPARFTTALSSGEISRERLIEVAVFAPQWAAFAAEAMGEPGLQDAVNWMHAHTKTTEWVWQAKTRELWAGELSRLTPVPADELLEGAVDTDWFRRAYAAVGPELWARLYDAAKYACNGAGHTRVRLFADALLGRISVEQLAEGIREKRSQDAVRALGLVSLPKLETKRRADLLRRYRVLAEFRHGSAKAKAQRRASEELAARIGLDNLARAAGHSDPERFTWAMETEAAADLAAGPLRAHAGDVTVTLDVTPAGKLELAASRAGKSLKVVPAAAKKHPAVVALLERREEARDQVARMRPALEDLMVRGLPLPASEWRGLMRHPFVAPLLRRLVLTAETDPLGFPAEDGAGLVDAAGALQSWPNDATPLRIAHPADLLPAGLWHVWQRACFDRQITQPFKQLFRELYVLVENERGQHGESLRYEGHVVEPRKALALLGKRSWVHHPDEGLHRVFHDAGIVAWLDFAETFYRASDLSSLAITRVRFCPKAGQPVPLDQVPARLFSEALRDVDLIVSVAHVTGVDPETSRPSLEMRAALIRETCRLLRFANVLVEPPVARIAGQRASYRVHLGSGVVHLTSGRMIHLQAVGNAERLFLPFADDDPKSVEILSKVLWLADDGAIKDPGFLAQIDV